MRTKLSSLPCGTRVRIIQMFPTPYDMEGLKYESFAGLKGTILTNHTSIIEFDEVVNYSGINTAKTFICFGDFELENLTDPDGNY